MTPASDPWMSNMGSYMGQPYWAEEEHLVTGAEHTVPSAVEISGKFPYWRLGRKQSPPLRTEDLEGFAELYDATGPGIAQFASRFGALRICKHGLPASHLTAPTPCTPLKGAGQWQGWFREPLADWVRFASEVDAMLLMAPDLSAGKPALIDALEVFGTHADRSSSALTDLDPFGLVDPNSDLRIATEIINSGRKPSAKQARAAYAELQGHLAYERQELALYVTRWLQMGGVGPSAEWVQGRGLEQTWKGEGLFGALALKLAAEVADGGRVECAGCRKLIRPTHARSGQRHWCPACSTPKGKSVRDKTIDRERRQRRKEGIPADEGRGRYASKAVPSRGPCAGAVSRRKAPKV